MINTRLDHLKPLAELRVLQAGSYFICQWNKITFSNARITTCLAPSVAVAKLSTIQKLKDQLFDELDWDVTLDSKYPVSFSKRISLAPLKKGCCFGMCVQFISSCLQGNDLTEIAESFSKGASYAAVMAQILYHRHLAPNAPADAKAMEKFCHFYRAEDYDKCDRMFLKRMSSAYMDEMSYATLLEMENLLDGEAPFPYFRLQYRAKNDVAEKFGFSFGLPTKSVGSVNELSEWLFSQESGIYLISISQHALVYILYEDTTVVLFDPAKGTYVFDSNQVKRLAHHLKKWSSSSHEMTLYPLVSSEI